MTTIVPRRDEAGAIDGYVSIRYDITARKEAEASLVREALYRRKTEEFLRDLIEAIPSGIAAYDSDDELVLWNSAFSEFVSIGNPDATRYVRFGESAKSSKESSFFELNEEARPQEPEVGNRGDLIRLPEFIEPSTHKISDGRWVQVQGRQSSTGHIVQVVTDISRIKEAEEKIRRQVGIDPLTGILNRIGLNAELEAAIAEYGDGSGKNFGLAFLDVDRFKQVNDRLGHDAGDTILKVIAKRIGKLSQVRAVARMGGDEFAVLIDMSDLERAALCALGEQARQYVFQPVMYNDKSIAISGSVGLATFPEDSQDSEFLKRAADEALLVAKRGGRGRVQIVDDAILAASKRRRLIEKSLANAIDQRQIVPAYQPIVTAGDHSIKGMEVLARWQHPEIGPIPPTEFIPIAQDCGLLADLDKMMLEQACNEARDWLESRAIDCLSFNASPQEICARGFATEFLATLHRLKISPDTICLEILESSLVSDLKTARSNLQRLSESGIRVSIDDFGTGFSNLQTTLELPINGLKFDRSMIQNRTQSPYLTEIVRGLAATCRAFGIYTVAEGVETAKDLEFANQVGCQLLQGYLIAAPMIYDDADAFIRRKGLRNKVKPGLSWVA